MNTADVNTRPVERIENGEGWGRTENAGASSPSCFSTVEFVQHAVVCR